MRRPAPAGRLGGSLAIAAALHATALAALFLARPSAPTPMPPIYRVDLVAAPPGPRAVGSVAPAAPNPPPPSAQVPPRAETRPTAPVLPSATPAARRPPAPATPVPPTSQPATPNAARAGGGPTGGRGADVANIRTQGIEFPYPGYLANIVRQVALNFQPKNPSAPLRAEVRFLIHRDGSVSELTVVTRSGSYAFDLDAQGAVEAAAAARAFGPLPAGFRDDVLPVVFSFDPSLLR